MAKCKQASKDWVGTTDDKERTAQVTACEEAATKASDEFSGLTDKMACMRDRTAEYNSAVNEWNGAEAGSGVSAINFALSHIQTSTPMDTGLSNDKLGEIKKGGTNDMQTALALTDQVANFTRGWPSRNPGTGAMRQRGTAYSEVLSIPFEEELDDRYKGRARTDTVKKNITLTRLLDKHKAELGDDHATLAAIAGKLEKSMKELSECVKHLEAAANKYKDANAKRRSWNETDPNIFAPIVGGDQYRDQALKKAAAESNARSGNIAVAHSNYKDRLKFKSQCLLLAKILELADIKKTQIDRARPKRRPNSDGTSNACLMVDGDPYGFLNRLTQTSSHQAFFNMRPEQISSLQPMIRLYKIKTSRNGKPYQQEIKFDSFASEKDVRGVFEERTKRGFGVGVKNFSFTYDGSNPFSVKKSIKAKLSIFANSFDELLVDRAADIGPAYRYADLALKTGKLTFAKGGKIDSKTKKARAAAQIQDKMDKLDFRLKAVVGWALPRGGAPSAGLKEAVYDSFVTLNLTPTTHEFDIDDQGRVNFTINYLAYIEDFFDQPQFNIFTHRETMWKQLQRKLRWEALRDNDDCGAEKIKEEKKKLADTGEIIKEKRTALMQIIQDLLDQDQIQNIQMTEQEIVDFRSKGPFFESKKSTGIAVDKDGRIKTELQKAINKAKNEEVSKGSDEKSAYNLAISRVSTDRTKQFISFFYLSSLVDVILLGIENSLTNMHESLQDPATAKSIGDDDLVAQEKENLRKFKEQFKRYRVLLGPLEVQNPQTAPYGSKFVNLGDIPISVEYFLQWMTDKLLKKEETVYHLPKFLNDLINHFVRNFMNDDSCFSMNLKQKVRVNQAAVTSYQVGRNKGDEITNMMRMQEGKKRGKLSRAVIGPWGKRGNYPLPILNISGVRGTPISDIGVGQETNYMIFYAGRTQPTEKMKGIRSQDEARGVFHYSIGRDSGIVKKINLQKTDSKYLKEVRFEQEGFDGLQQLREVYDVEISCFANPHAFPGTYIYVEPRGFAPNTTRATKGQDPTFDLTRYGVGGYHMIISSTHTFGPGQADTTVRAKWVAQIDAEGVDTQAEAADGGRTQKCVVGNSNRETEAGSSWTKAFGLKSIGNVSAPDVDQNPN